MPLESDLFSFKILTAADFESYKTWYMNEDVMLFITGNAPSFDQVDMRFQKALGTNRTYPNMGWHLVYLKATQVFIGIVKLTPLGAYEAEVGYGILPEFWGNGYGREMLRALVAHAINLGSIGSLVAITHPDNAASRRILENASFTFEHSKEGELGQSDYFKRILKPS